MIRPIVTYPDPRLRQASRPVERFDDDLRELVADMFETMRAAEGIGLAAVQIGVHLRLAVMAVEDNPERVLANPRYEILGESMDLNEGCLSVPGVRELTRTRADHVRVQAFDLDGEPYEFEANGLEAACVQHECDHIDGRLYIDHLSSLRRRRALKRYQKEQERGEDA
jgi:peptide deformylase